VRGDGSRRGRGIVQSAGPVERGSTIIVRSYVHLCLVESVQ